MKKGKKSVACAIAAAISLSAFSGLVGMTKLGPLGADVVSAATGATTPASKPAALKQTTSTKKTTTSQAATNVSRILKLGSKGSDVKTLQTLLNDNGYKLAVDGIFGKKTLTAVKSFQKANGLAVDGKVGPKTLAVLKPAPAPTPAPAPAPAPVAAVESKIVKMGLGHITTIGKSKDLGKDKDGKEVLPVGEVNTVIVAAGFDKDGKVVSVTIDTAQSKVEYYNDLTLKSDVKTEGKTKNELKEEYGMLKSSKIGKEWYQQADALGKWMVGKTIDEINGMKVKTEGTKTLTAEPDLVTSVTIGISDYTKALQEAYNNAVEVKGAVKVGLGHNISMAKSKGLGKDKDGKDILPVAEVNTVMAATAFDKDGKVAGTMIDTAQTKINFDKDGKVTSDKNAEYKTKNELKEGYGMLKSSKIGKEWYQQAAALGKWMVGKTIDQINGMKVKTVGDKILADEPDVVTSVTIGISDYQKAVTESFQNAK